MAPSKARRRVQAPTEPTMATVATTSVWRAYLSERAGAKGVAAAASALISSSSLSLTATHRSRKRPKPSGFFGPTPTAHTSAATESTTTTLRGQIRAYWEALGVADRLRVLFVDTPELVKQLYKLNLSLLCVGLMQRHLKTPGAQAKKPQQQQQQQQQQQSVPVAAPAIPTTSTTTSSSSSSSATSDEEKTYELLEAMEFMDIGTGILTVKSELAEEPPRLFALVDAVLPGFLTSLHVLDDDQFHALLLHESELINSWEDYERLIAMLVEQLIFRGYVAHREQEATQQMEQLLLEVSLEETATTTATVARKAPRKKKNKKKKAAKSGKLSSSSIASVDHQQQQQQLEEERPVDPADEASDSEPEEELLLLPLSIADDIDLEMPLARADDDCGGGGAGAGGDNDDDDEDAATIDTEDSGPSSPIKALVRVPSSGLNPHARVYEPSFNRTRPPPMASLTAVVDALRSPSNGCGKRKLDDFILRIPWEDLDGDGDEGSTRCGTWGDVEEDPEDGELVDLLSGELGCRRRREKHRRRNDEDDEDDATLAWRLQQMYASTSSLFGWDFVQQREIPELGRDAWSEATLWRTEPRDVVRYYLPPPSLGAFPSPGPMYPPPSHGLAYDPHQSRYYFATAAPPLTISASSPVAHPSTPSAASPVTPPTNPITTAFYPQDQRVTERGPVSIWGETQARTRDRSSSIVATAEFPRTPFSRGDVDANDVR